MITEFDITQYDCKNAATLCIFLFRQKLQNLTFISLPIEIFPKCWCNNINIHLTYCISIQSMTIHEKNILH